MIETVIVKSYDGNLVRVPLNKKDEYLKKITDEADLTDVMYEDASMHNENGAWQMIFGVITVPEARKKGNASYLLQHVINEAEKQGRKGLVLTCKDSLIHFYERHGFVNEGVSDKSFHGGVSWYQMRLSF